jgi:hypothetical protein
LLQAVEKKLFLAKTSFFIVKFYHGNLHPSARCASRVTRGSSATGLWFLRPWANPLSTFSQSVLKYRFQCYQEENSHMKFNLRGQLCYFPGTVFCLLGAVAFSLSWFFKESVEHLLNGRLFLALWEQQSDEQLSDIGTNSHDLAPVEKR